MSVATGSQAGRQPSKPSRRIVVVRQWILLISIPMIIALAGCHNQAEDHQIEELKLTVANQQQRIEELNQATIRQAATISQQQSSLADNQKVITDLRKNPKSAPWWQQFLDRILAWIAQVFGQWAVDQAKEFIEGIVDDILKSLY